MRAILKLVLAAALIAQALPADALNSRQRNKLEQAQNAFAAAIRWGDFEGAWQMVDPAVRERDPMTELEFARYEQIQVSGYRDLHALVEADGTLVRVIELRVINRHTMAERTQRFRERWRWDEAAKRWWLADTLPDLWEGS
ncbi:hypothetical protein [Pseudoxanthomonas mexicana]|uniref:hypothetical protein n=1 Tax=Pseudoxanthomonas mexicana TaxID=128785 RepID=UPI00398A9597